MGHPAAETNVKNVVVLALLLTAPAAASYAQEPAPAIGQSAPLATGAAANAPSPAPSSGAGVAPAPSPTPSIGTLPGLSAGPSGTAFGRAGQVSTGGGGNAPAPLGIEAPSAAPPVGVPVRLGNFADLLATGNSVGGLAFARPPGLTITPSIALQEELTSNAIGASNGGQSDLITTITPGILVNLATPRAVGTLNYTPSAQIYARNSDDDNIAQALNGFAQAELLPQTLFLSLNAFVSTQNTFGGLTPAGTSVISPNNRTTSTGFVVNPSFVHRFEEIGTLRLGYALSEASNSGDEAFLPSSSTPFFAPSYALTNQATASFTTGPAFGRFNDVVAAMFERSTGTGVLDGAHQYVFSDTLRYAVLRQLYVFGTLGRENIFYASEPPLEINDTIWAGGVTLIPNAASTITVGYGHFQGEDSPFVTATVALSARTILTASYSDLLGTSLQSLQSGLFNSVVSPTGVPVDNQTGAPVLLTNQLLSLQSSVSRNQIFSAGVISTWPRDTYALTFLDEKQKLIANGPGTTGFSQSSVSAGLSWAHVLTPALTSFAYVQGGTTTSAAVGRSTTPTFAAQFSLLNRFTPTLTGSASLQFTNQWLGNGFNTTNNAFQASLILAVQKVF